MYLTKLTALLRQNINLEIIKETIKALQPYPGRGRKLLAHETGLSFAINFAQEFH